MSKNNKETDVIVVGGGLAGLTLTAILGAAGIRVFCADRFPRTEVKSDADLRTTAISYGSRMVLERAGVWNSIEPEACPIRDIHIYDGDSPLLLNFFSDEVEGKSFGWIVENRILKHALYDRIDGLKTVDFIAPAEFSNFKTDPEYVEVDCNGQHIKAKLLVGADGRHSTVRDWLGIQTRAWSYEQFANICNVIHENPHESIAIEHFHSAGPFAILPMQDNENGEHRSSVVFTQDKSRQSATKKLNDEEFLKMLQDRFPDFYGSIRMEGKRKVYPLGLVHAAKYIGKRSVLVADAAHGIHPIAGQGLNLGFRDIHEISILVIDAYQAGNDIGEKDLLEIYQRRRRPDNIAMIAVTDSLNKLFANNVVPIRMARRFGLKFVSVMPPVKRFLMKQAMGDRIR